MRRYAKMLQYDRETTHVKATFPSGLFLSLDLRTYSHGGPTSQTTIRTRTVCTSWGWISLNLGYSTMISAPPQRSLSAKKVWYAIFFIQISLVLYSYCISYLFFVLSLRSQGTRTSSPAPNIWTRLTWCNTDHYASSMIWHWWHVCVYLDMCIYELLWDVFVSQDGMRNVVIGCLTLLTTTATCLTTCRWGRGRRLEPTASTREETSSVSPIPLNRPSYKVGFLHLYSALILILLISIIIYYLFNSSIYQQ